MSNNYSKLRYNTGSREEWCANNIYDFGNNYSKLRYNKENDYEKQRNLCKNVTITLS